MEKTPWSVPVAVDDIPETGLHMEIEAPADVRTALAKLANVANVARLSAVFDLTRQGAAAHVAGRVSALVGQLCVVSLEPIENPVDEAIDVTFAPGAGTVAGRDEPAEPLRAGGLDLGAVATEFLLLGIDPYPRKAGVEFASPRVEEGGPRPFAALATLKKGLGSGKS